MALEQKTDYGVVNGFILSALAYLVITMLVGVLASFQFIWPDWASGIPYLSYGRIRPIHTNGTLFGWLTTGFIGFWYYAIPRLCNTKLYSKKLAWLSLVLWNIIILSAVVTLALGMNQGKEYAELILPIDVLVVVTWVIILINIFATIAKRKEKQMYVTVWYTMGTLVWVALVYIIGNNPMYTGINDANINWFYGHNAVGLLFTTSGVGMGYYFIPKAAKTPLWNHTLSMIGFWGLGFIYVWTGAHHLVYSPVPEWIQTMGIMFSILLIIPTMAVIINFYMTVKGKWYEMNTNVPLKFLMVGTTMYLLTCLQGPFQSLRTVSQITHFTDWVVGHVHMAMAGFATFMMFGAIYYMVPQIVKRPLWSEKAANWHFWLTLIGLTGYMVSLWVIGVIQGTMWKDVSIPFVETVIISVPYWKVRTVSGILMVSAQFIFVYNIVKTLFQKTSDAS